MEFRVRGGGLHAFAEKTLRRRALMKAGAKLNGEVDGYGEVAVGVVVVVEAPGFDGEGAAFVRELVADIWDGKEAFAFGEGEGFSGLSLVYDGDVHLCSWGWVGAWCWRLDAE